MAIAASDIELRISGGASNTDPDAALGGAISTVGGGVVVTNVQNNVFDDITSAEASAGTTLYRGLYYKNNHGSLSYQTPVIWFSSQTSSGDTSAEMAIAGEAKNVAEEIIASETTAPSGESFSAPASKGAGLSLGTLDAADYKGWWLKYIVNSSAAAVLDSMTTDVEGDSDP